MPDFTPQQFEQLAAQAQGVLGYKAIVNSPASDGEKLRRLYNVMQCIGGLCVRRSRIWRAAI